MPLYNTYISVDMEYIYRAQDANTRSILCSFGHELSQLQLTQWTELKIETGRYGVNRVPVEERLCEICNSVEDEFHVLMKCPLYRDARDICFNSISAVSEVFADLPQESQFIELMSNPLHYKIISKFMYTILNQRRYLLYL